MNNKIILLGVETLFAFNFNIGGQISLGELITLLFVFTHFKEIQSLFKLYKQIPYMYGILFFTQLLSEIFVSNGLNDSIRGLMVTIVSFSHFTFLFYYGIKKPSNIIYAFIGFAVAIFIGIDNETLETNKILNGENAAFVKMKLVNIVGMLLVFISFYISKKNILFLLSFLFGTSMIILGARNGGSTIILSGIIATFFNIKKINIQKVIFITVGILCFSYILYIIYVNNVLSGNIKSGNNIQIYALKNPYNPIELLINGRGEFFVGIQAFIDKFLFGHGAWAKDTTGKYWILLSKIKNTPNVFIGVWLPVHSVLIGWGVYNGIFAFCSGLKIFIYVLKCSYRSFILNTSHSQLIYCLSYSTIAFIWNILFSPPSHFRLTLPLFMAGILVSFHFNRIKHIKTR